MLSPNPGAVPQPWVLSPGPGLSHRLIEHWPLSSPVQLPAFAATNLQVVSLLSAHSDGTAGPGLFGQHIVSGGDMCPRWDGALHCPLVTFEKLRARSVWLRCEAEPLTVPEGPQGSPPVPSM